MHTLSEKARAAIADILPPEEILEPSSELYTKESTTWAAQKQQHPALVVRPGSAERLQKLVPYLYESGLDFAIRCGGIGSSSAKDVVVSMKQFDSFKYNPDDHTIVVGAGQLWGDIEQKLEEVAPARIAVSARVPWVGVAGSTLSGCLSWVGTEFGLGADPQNMLDVEIVLRDGRKIWASTEPDLLWALRGGGGNFGVVTAFHFRTYPYSTSIHCGYISYPPSALEAVSRGIAEHAARPIDPRVSFHCLIGAADEKFPGQSSWTESTDRKDRAVQFAKFHLGVFVFDAYGEEHGRSDKGFKWAFDIPGAVDKTVVTTIRGANELQSANKNLVGATNSYLNACLADEIDPEFVIRGKNWVEGISSLDSRLGPGTLFLLEVMPGKTFNATSSPEETAWPHSSNKHVLQLLTGSHPDSNCPEELALHALAMAPYIIKKTHSKEEFFPNFLESINDRSAIFGVNYGKILEVKKKYDPQQRFNKGSFIPIPSDRKDSVQSSI
ncbi:FAD-linked oxidoreductase afoF [Lasiodiplodia theobromae]|uniref:FAD-linked oxidoreductase afoF n=1 Tax=Lasiodiplodia theobromae TaxID=45133 RepID=A0A5N5DS97_9PEZI|nr:FAD-linked oxidoreductase afoF [Lasiodiplodia theobromae]